MTKPYYNYITESKTFKQEQFEHDIIDAFENEPNIASIDFTFGKNEDGTEFVQGFIHHDEGTPEIAFSMRDYMYDDRMNVLINMGYYEHIVYRAENADVINQLKKMYVHSKELAVQQEHKREALPQVDISDLVEDESSLGK
mgnify:FL=1